MSMVVHKISKLNTACIEYFDPKNMFRHHKNTSFSGMTCLLIRVNFIQWCMANVSAKRLSLRTGSVFLLPIHQLGNPETLYFYYNKTYYCWQDESILQTLDLVLSAKSLYRMRIETPWTTLKWQRWTLSWNCARSSSPPSPLVQSLTQLANLQLNRDSGGGGVRYFVCCMMLKRSANGESSWAVWLTRTSVKAGRFLPWQVCKSISVLVKMSVVLPHNLFTLLTNKLLIGLEYPKHCFCYCDNNITGCASANLFSTSHEIVVRIVGRGRQKRKK